MGAVEPPPPKIIIYVYVFGTHCEYELVCHTLRTRSDIRSLLCIQRCATLNNIPSPSC